MSRMFRVGGHILGFRIFDKLQTVCGFKLSVGHIPPVHRQRISSSDNGCNIKHYELSVWDYYVRCCLLLLW
jgi:hypothetical protein